MKAVLISIRPKWCEKIASGRKTIEVRKSAPKETPFKAYIYCTKAKSQWRYSDYEGAYQNSEGEIVYAQQHVIGEFVCDKVDMSFVGYMKNEPCYWDILDGSCLTKDEIMNYGKWKTLYGLHISDLKIYNKPKELSEFKTPPCEKPEKACENCKYRVVINTPDVYEVDCFVENGREITRPPQSWMYIEEVQR